MPCWLAPFVPWQLAQAAERWRPRLGSGPCARAGKVRAAPKASAATSSGWIMASSSRMFRVSFRPDGLSRGGPAKTKAARGDLSSASRRRLCFRSHLGHFFFYKLECDFVRLDIHRDLPAVGELAEEQLVGERAANRVLDEPRHRARTHQRIEAVPGEVLAQHVGKHRLDLFLLQLNLQLHEELVHDTQDDVVIERLERDRRVQSIPEFRR